ncbi:MAG: pyridoxamine 5'-phosphate oxidase family protein, partial [Acidobacteriota bacterium]
VVFGVAELIEEREAKIEALRVIVEHLVPGRWNDVRLPNEKELKGTSVLSLALDEASVKIRTGPPKDDDEDYELPIWAGEVPLQSVAGAPQSDPRLPSNLPEPPYLQNYRR